MIGYHFAVRFHRALLPVVVAFGMILGPAAAASAAGSEPDAASICEALEEMVASDPDAVLKIIDQLRAPGWAELANAGANPALTSLRTQCEQARLKALDALANPSSPTFPKSVVGLWKALTETWVAPFAAPAGTALALAVALLLGARFGTLLPGVRNGRVRPSHRRGVGIVAVGLVVVGSFAAVGSALMQQQVGISAPGLHAAWVAATVLAALIALAGALFVSLYLAGRLRLTIDVYDAKGLADAGASSRITALLYQMGAAPPRDLDVPVGTELQALADADLPTSVGGKPWAFLQPILSFVFLGTPWRIRVDTDSATFADVKVRRNGKPIYVPEIRLNVQGSWTLPASRRIDASSAAAIIVTLASGYDSGFEGLTGVTRGASLAMGFLAVNDLEPGPERSKLLTAAAAADRRNVLAEFNRRSDADRRSSDPVRLADLANWLQATASSATETAVEILTRRTLAVTAINLDAALENTADAEEQLRPAPIPVPQQVKNLQTLITLLVDESALRSATTLATARKHAAVALRIVVPTQPTLPAAPASGDTLDPSERSRIAAIIKAYEESKTWFAEVESSAVASDVFNMACLYDRTDKLDLAVAKLKEAVKDPKYKQIARTDPTLSHARAANPALVYDTVRYDEWMLEPFAAVKTGARAAGVFRLQELVLFPSTKEFAKQLGVSRYELVRVQAAAGFTSRAIALEDAAVSAGFRLELVAELLKRGVNNESQLPLDWTVPSADSADNVPATIAAEFRERFADAPNEAALRAWLLRVRTSGSSTADAEFDQLASSLG